MTLKARYTLVNPKNAASWMNLADFIPGVEPYEVETHLTLTALDRDHTRVVLDFDESQAEEAARWYAGIFPGGKLGAIRRFPVGARGQEGSVMTASFEIAGHEIVALNCNQRHAFSPASSLLIRCANDAEAARVTEKLSEGDEKQPGGWLRDRYGVSWQISAG